MKRQKAPGGERSALCRGLLWFCDQLVVSVGMELGVV